MTAVSSSTATPATATEESAVDAALGGNGNPDLSAGGLPAVQTQRISLATEESAHRINQQRTLFSSLIALIVLLYMIGAVFSGIALYIASQGQPKVDWHTWLLGLTFIIPPTVLSIVLVRATYSRPQQDDATENLPALNLMKEVAKACADAFKAAKGS